MKTLYLFTLLDRKRKDHYIKAEFKKLTHIPRQGDLVRLGDTEQENLYSVKGVSHRYFEDRHEIVIHLK